MWFHPRCRRLLAVGLTDAVEDADHALLPRIRHGLFKARRLIKGFKEEFDQEDGSKPIGWIMCKSHLRLALSR